MEIQRKHLDTPSGDPKFFTSDPFYELLV